MGFPYSEDFEGGGFPTGWAHYTVSTTSSPTGVTPTSGTTVADMPSNVLSTLTYFQTYQSADTNGGDVQVRCNFCVPSIASQTQSAVLFARGSSNDVQSGTPSYYSVRLDWVNSQIIPAKTLSGSTTTLAGSVAVALAADAWYQATWTPSGTSLSFTLQRLADGYWLNSSGTFQSSAATAISITDSSIAGAGYCGFGLAGKGAAVYADDWAFDVPGTGANRLLLESGSRVLLESGTSSLLAEGGGVPGSSGSLSRTEAHDTASIAGASVAAATLSRTEQHDTAAIAGTCTIGSVAATERRDAAAIAGVAPSAILTRQDGPDTPSIAGHFASAATTAATEARDTPALFGSQLAGSIASAEARDTATFAATFASVGTIAATGRHDTAAIAATAHNTVTLAGQERPDIVALSGSVAARARIARIEGGDVGVAHGTTAVRAGLAAGESPDRGSIAAVAEGVPPFLAAMEAGDVGAFSGATGTLHYNVYDSGPIDSPVNYAVAIAGTAATTWTSPFTLAPGTWRFAVRAEDAAGEEQNVDCVVTVIIDAAGRDISSRPAPVLGLRAIPLKNGSIKVEWSAALGGDPAARATSYAVYRTAGPTPSFGEPAATMLASEGFLGLYTVTLAGGVDEQQYSIACRSVNAYGDDGSTAFVTAVAEVAGPTVPVVGLTGTLTT